MDSTIERRSHRTGHPGARSVSGTLTAGCVLAIGLVACSASGRADSSPEAVTRAASATPPSAADGAFHGVWEACDAATSPDQCSRYVLVQRGPRVCGTWSYVATGDAYEGRLAARVVSPTEARRTHVCGRPGSEANTECEAGWDRVDTPLRLCDGKLGDTASKQGSCFADFERVPSADAELAALAGQPWAQACLSGAQPEAVR